MAYESLLDNDTLKADFKQIKDMLTKRLAEAVTEDDYCDIINLCDDLSNLANRIRDKAEVLSELAEG